MIGLGTILNTAGILLGGLLGLLGGKWLSPRCQDTLTKASGVCVLFVGISGALEHMLAGDGAGGTLMVIASFALGSLLGEWLDLESRLERFGQWLKVKTGNSGDPRFLDGFVTASLTVCVGAMAIVGAIEDGVSGDFSILALKAVLDFIIILVMSASLGRGCVFSAIPVALLQGSVTLLARLISPLIIQPALDSLSLTGSILIFCVGVNLIWEKKFRVVNMLPAIVFAFLWAYAAR